MGIDKILSHFASILYQGWDAAKQD